MAEGYYWDVDGSVLIYTLSASWNFQLFNIIYITGLQGFSTFDIM